MNPYRHLVAGLARLLQEGRAVPRPPPPARPPVAAGAPMAVIFAPHPDDETITGGLALRLRQELRLNVAVVVVTLGSRRERRAERWRELSDACNYLGFGLLAAAPDGLENVTPVYRQRHPEAWSAAVAVIAGILAAQRPAMIFLPHAGDWHPTHVGTHWLVLDALPRLGADFACQVVETEFWGAMDAPNLLVESDIDDVAGLMAALSLHAGEVARNPYHLRLPAWMMDNVRRGAERLGGRGAVAPDIAFATLYRRRRWAGGRLSDVPDAGRIVACGDDLSWLLR